MKRKILLIVSAASMPFWSMLLYNSFQSITGATDTGAGFGASLGTIGLSSAVLFALLNGNKL